jgi:hypothetical protein
MQIEWFVCGPVPPYQLEILTIPDLMLWTMLSFGECCVETSAKNNLGVQDDVSLLPEQFLRKRHEQKGPLKLHCCSLHKLKLDQKNPNYR